MKTSNADYIPKANEYNNENLLKILQNSVVLRNVDLNANYLLESFTCYRYE